MAKEYSQRLEESQERILSKINESAPFFGLESAADRRGECFPITSDSKSQHSASSSFHAVSAHIAWYKPQPPPLAPLASGCDSPADAIPPARALPALLIHRPSPIKSVIIKRRSALRTRQCDQLRRRRRRPKSSHDLRRLAPKQSLQLGRRSGHTKDTADPGNRRGCEDIPRGKLGERGSIFTSTAIRRWSTRNRVGG